MTAATQLHLFTSNRLEVLSAFLAQLLKRPLSSPFTPEIIVVQSPGMARWIAMEIARYHGVCANVRFPFPNDFIHESVFSKILPDVPETAPFDRNTLTWQIMGLLPELTGHPAFGEVRRYLGGDRDDLKRFQLAEKIAYAFDQYLLFRPEMILEWEAGGTDHWQAVLWRAVGRGRGRHHRPALREAFLQRIETLERPADWLPERVAVFGVSTLPPFHLHIFETLSRHCEVNLFIMNPCREYWGDLLTGRETRRLERRAEGEARPDLYLTPGNPLLAAMGGLGRDFFDRLTEAGPAETPVFLDPADDSPSLLAALQSDILNLRETGRTGEERRTVDPADDSVQIHACHGPMREIEVLHDQLLDLFRRYPDLPPREILVMTPDIETYAPYIQAVFDRPGDDPLRIPFSIADRSFRTESRIIETFLRILDLWGGRYGAAEVMAILETAAVRAAFDLTEPDLDRIRRWVRETGIRWGIDADHRRRHGLPGYPQNTWRAGLDRLLLGVALPGGDRIYQSILPYDLEGEETEVLGRFLTFCERLFDFVEGLREARTLSRWSGDLSRAVELLFMTGEESEPEERALQSLLQELGEGGVRAGNEGEIAFPAVRAFLRGRLSDQGFGYGFITGGVTFCQTLPMRSIPFQVICMVGMDSDRYPRRDTAPGFDLISRHPRPGDRSARSDDRYLFLESILSARRQLYISYVGQSIQDNSVIPPSVLVSELLDYINNGYHLAQGEIVDDRVRVRHRLQPFSPAYFDPATDPRLFSYSEEHCRTANRSVSPREAPVPFFQEDLPEPPAERRAVSLDDLSRFLCNPARFLLNQRLGIHFEEGDGGLEEAEPFTLSGLERYTVAQRLVERALRHPDGPGTKEPGTKENDEWLDLEAACGRLPHGAVGRCLFTALRRETASFAEKTGPLLKGAPLPPLPVDLAVGGFRLTGRIREVYPDRLVRYRYAQVKAEDHLRLWVAHLALNLSGAGGYPHASLLIGLENGQWSASRYGPVDDPAGELERLLSLYWQGLRRPLHFFPKSSWIFAHDTLKKGKPAEVALKTAGSAWRPDREEVWAEADDPHYDRCFRHTDPLDAEFRELAIRVFGPMIAAMTE
jgi:exodeoxyribonuclease V gamma subunit